MPLPPNWRERARSWRRSPSISPRRTPDKVDGPACRAAGRPSGECRGPGRRGSIRRRNARRGPADVLAVNAGALTTLSAAVLPGMRARGRRHSERGVHRRRAASPVLRRLRRKQGLRSEPDARALGREPGQRSAHRGCRARVTRTNLGGETPARCAADWRSWISRSPRMWPRRRSTRSMRTTRTHPRRTQRDLLGGARPVADTLAARVIAAFKG